MKYTYLDLPHIGRSAQHPDIDVGMRRQKRSLARLAAGIRHKRVKMEDNARQRLRKRVRVRRDQTILQDAVHRVALSGALAAANEGTRWRLDIEVYERHGRLSGRDVLDTLQLRDFTAQEAVLGEHAVYMLADRLGENWRVAGLVIVEGFGVEPEKLEFLDDAAVVCERNACHCHCCRLTIQLQRMKGTKIFQTKVKTKGKNESFPAHSI